MAAIKSICVKFVTLYNKNLFFLIKKGEYNGKRPDNIIAWIVDNIDNHEDNYKIMRYLFWILEAIDSYEEEFIPG